LRIPTAFTAAPVTSSPAATSIARWKASVEADREATRTSCATSPVVSFNGATCAQNRADCTSVDGTSLPMAL